VTDRYSLFVDLLRHYFAWPDEEEDGGRVARIAAALREANEGGALSSSRAGEIGPLLADLLSLRWGDDEDLRLKNTDPEQRRQQTLLAVRDLLLALARQRPLVLVLEDLHWADSLSLDLISLLMESLAQVPLLLLCSYRPDREYRCSRLGTIAAQKCPDCSTELRLKELTPSQSQQLVVSLLGTPELPPPVKELILDRSRGNPFFTEEVVYSLVDGDILYQEGGAWRVREASGRLRIPESVQGVILGRVDRLEPELKRVLQHAAVIGRVFDRRLLEAALGEATLLEQRLWELEERGLIYQERVIPEQEYSFRHALLQETVYQGNLRSQRAGLHRQVAEAIEVRHAGRLDGYYKQLAFHYERGGADAENQERALGYLVRGAEQAHRTAAHREEAALLAQAIAIAERLGRQEQLGALHARRGTALSRNCRWAEARAELEAALTALPSDHAEDRAEILTDLAGVSYWGVDAPRVRPHAQEGLAQAERAHREDLAGAALGWLAAADQMDGELRVSVRRFGQAMEKAGGFRTASVLPNMPLAHYLLGEYGEALRRARQAVAIIRELNNTSATMFALSHLGLALGATGAYAEATTVFEEARQFGIEYEVGHFAARAGAMSAGFHLDVYDFAGHEALAEAAREMARRTNFPPSAVSAGIDLLLSYARRGEIARAESLVPEVTAQMERVGGWHGWLWQLRLTQARAEIALARGEAQEAQRLAEEAIRQSRRRERVKYQVAGLITRGQALAARKQCREAIRDLESALALARPVGDPAMFLRAATALLALDGDGDLAAEARAAAKRIATALPGEPMRCRFAAAEPVRRLGGLV
jgi:tetratricopeptide (TPR) repeat protein